MHFPVTVTLGEVPDGVSKLLLEQALMASCHLPNLPLQSRADVRAAGWGSGSFMSLAPLADDAAPAIDEENLRRILNRKSWPAARGDEDAEVNHDK